MAQCDTSNLYFITGKGEEGNIFIFKTAFSSDFCLPFTKLKKETKRNEQNKLNKTKKNR